MLSSRAAGLLLAVLLACGCRAFAPVVPAPPGAGERGSGFEEVDRLLEGFRERHAFPGGVVAVGERQGLLHLHPFGGLTYEAAAPPVTAGTLYDLASLTTVVATTTLAMIFTRRAGIPGSNRALGWDTKSAEGSSAGTLFSPTSYGYTGFTGTSLWIDPERGLFVLLLTNRVHPARENNLIREARPAVADAVVRALGP